MPIAAPPATKPVAVVIFRGARVKLDYDQERLSFLLVSKFRGKRQTLRFQEEVDDVLGSQEALETSKLQVAPIGVDGRSYLVVTLGIHPNSGGLAGAAHVFGIDHGHLREVGQLASNQMFRFVKTSPGHQAVARSYEVGSHMSHAAMPRWEEYFQVRDAHLVELTRSARLFRAWMKELWSVLGDHPDDGDCWHYYGLAGEGVRIVGLAEGGVSANAGSSLSLGTR